MENLPFKYIKKKKKTHNLDKLSLEFYYKP